MRKLYDIIEAVKANGFVNEEELRYAICAMDALATFDSLALSRLSESEEKQQRPVLTSSAVWQYSESFNRWKRALDKSPKEYIGWNNDPENPEYQHRRGIAFKLFNRFMEARGEPT